MSDDREDMHRLRRSAASGARWTAVATFTRIATQFLQLAFLARLLDGAEAFGLFAMVNVVITLGLAMGDVGISNAIIHFQDATRRELSSLYWLNVAAGLLVFALVYLSAPLVVAVFNEPALQSLVHLASVVFLLTPFGQQFQVLLERSLRFKRLATIETVSLVAAALVSVYLAYRYRNVEALIWAAIVHAGCKAFLLVVLADREWRPALRFRPAECSRFVRFGIFQVMERVVSTFSTQLDKVLIGALMGPVPLGYYDLAYRLTMRPFQIINPIVTRVGFPVLARVQHDNERLRRGFLEMINAVAAILAPIYAILVGLAAPIVAIQFGAGYDPVIPLLMILSMMGFLLGMGNPMGSILMAKGRTDIAFYLNVFRIALFTGAVLVGSRFGLEGIAWALLIALAGVQVPVAIAVRRRLIGLGAWPYIATFLPYALAGAAASGTALLATTRLDLGTITSLVVGTVVVGVVYLGILAVAHRRPLMRIVYLIRS